MKKFVNADIKEVAIEETAFGPLNPEDVDETKYAVVDDEGNIIGYRAKFGKADASRQ